MVNKTENYYRITMTTDKEKRSLLQIEESIENLMILYYSVLATIVFKVNKMYWSTYVSVELCSCPGRKANKCYH